MLYSFSNNCNKKCTKKQCFWFISLMLQQTNKNTFKKEERSVFFSNTFTFFVHLWVFFCASTVHQMKLLFQVFVEETADYFTEVNNHTNNASSVKIMDTQTGRIKPAKLLLFTFLCKSQEKTISFFCRVLTRVWNMLFQIHHISVNQNI